MHGAEADVVREKRGADDVVVPVHRVGSPDDRDGHPAAGRVHGSNVIGVGEPEPVVGLRLADVAGLSASAVED